MSDTPQDPQPEAIIEVAPEHEVPSFEHRHLVGYAEGNKHRPVWVEVRWDGKRLSFQGEVKPTRNGDAEASGQIIASVHDITPAEGWSVEDLDRLREYWKRWHLNDMRAGCEHQRADGWADRPIDPEKKAGVYGLHFEGQTQPTYNLLIWVRPDDFPGGLLTAPCPVCGYRYGTEWLTEPVPTDVLAWLSELPDESDNHPWKGI